MALRTISLRDFVIVKSLTLDFSGGFTALTGETGAGKSILIDAIQLALGTRSDTAFIRDGAARAEISVEFDCPDQCRGWLDEGGFATEDSIVLKRIIDRQGKSRAWINASLATVTQLRELGNALLDIHGQHAWQSLMRPETVRDLLDAYAGQSTEHLSELWHHWRRCTKVVEEARATQTSRQDELERLNWQIGEIEKLGPGEQEWGEINALHSRLAHAQSLMDACHLTLERLEGDNSGAVSMLAKAVAAVESMTHVEPRFHDIAELLRSSLIQSEEAAHSLHAYLRQSSPDPERLAELDKRMVQWIALARRYRLDPKDLHARLVAWRETRLQLESETDISALEANEKVALAAYTSEAERVSRRRHEAAPQLSQSVSTVIQDLGMRGGRFEVALDTLPDPAAHGLDGVSFLVAGHAGASLRPVGKVASGGELSRIALAIAVTTSRLGEAQTLIFDEVDAGIGGTVAQTVGRLMRQLGIDRQVLAVTHLPQVAAFADQHFVVEKKESDGTTFSLVREVDGDDRVAEIARMIGGHADSSASIAHAGEMLQRGQSVAQTSAMTTS